MQGGISPEKEIPGSEMCVTVIVELENFPVLFRQVRPAQFAHGSGPFHRILLELEMTSRRR